MNIKFMELAIKEAKYGSERGHGGPFGSVIVRDGRVVAQGHSMVLKKNNPTKHSDMEVISKAGQRLGTFDLKGCDLYTTSQPCPMCLSAALWANIDNIYYGIGDKDMIKIGHRIDMFKGIVCIESQSVINVQQFGYDICRAALDEYEQKGKKVTY